MKLNIPNEWAYFIFGAAVNHILSKINTYNMCYSLNKRKEVVDVMGDIVGYIDSKGDIHGN